MWHVRRSRTCLNAQTGGAGLGVDKKDRSWYVRCARSGSDGANSQRGAARPTPKTRVLAINTGGPAEWEGQRTVPRYRHRLSDLLTL